MMSKRHLFALVCLVAVLALVPNGSKNSCTNYFSYFLINFSSDCYLNPDLGDSVPNIIRRHVGISETHSVETEDGYILTLFRIPRNNSKGVIFMASAFLHDARVWVAQSNQSLAFILWRAGYDVWLGNGRGTLFSKKHRTLSPSDPSFWDFSLHEIGYHEQYAFVEYIKNATQREKIIYFGASMGGTLGLIYASTRADHAGSSLETMIILAPCTYFKHAKGLLEYIMPAMIPFLRDDRLGIYSVGDYDGWTVSLFRFFHTIIPFKKYIVYLIALLVGWTPDEFDPNFANVVVHQFGETSLRVVEHFYQFYESGGEFRAFDHGQHKNLQKYGRPEPVQYDLGQIQVPVLLVYSVDDILSHPQDNELLFRRLSAKRQIHSKLVIDGMNHFDMVYGKRRHEKVFHKILTFLDDVLNK